MTTTDQSTAAGAAPDPVRTAQQIARQARGPLRSIDAEYRGRQYRIGETTRLLGAGVRLAGDHVACAGCFKTIRPTTKRLVNGSGMDPHCIGCAVEVGLLIQTPLSVAVDAAEMAQREGIAWA